MKRKNQTQTTFDLEKRRDRRQASRVDLCNQTFQSIGMIARKVLVRCLHDASVEKGGTESFEPSPASIGAGSYAADSAGGSTIGKGGVRAMGGKAADAFGMAEGVDTTPNEKIR